MAFTAYISISNAGVDATVFNIYSNTDGYTTPFVTGVPKATLIAGITVNTVPDGTTTCRVTANCGTSIDMPINDPYIYVYARCGDGEKYYNPGVTTMVKVEDNNTPVPNCYEYYDQGLLSAMDALYALTYNPNLVISNCNCN